MKKKSKKNAEDKAAKKTTKKEKKGKKAAATKGGFPTVKKMNELRKAFAEEHGIKIITASKVKDYVKAMGLRVSGEFPEAVANLVYAEIWKAAKRTVGNDRKTVNSVDL